MKNFDFMGLLPLKSQNLSKNSFFHLCPETSHGKICLELWNDEATLTHLI